MLEKRGRTIKCLFFLISFFFLFSCACFNDTEEDIGNVDVTVIDRITGKEVVNCKVEIFLLKPDGSTSDVASVSTKPNGEGIGVVVLGIGTYQARAAGSWVGSTDFSLSKQDQDISVKLFVFQIAN